MSRQPSPAILTAALDGMATERQRILDIINGHLDEGYADIINDVLEQIVDDIAGGGAHTVVTKTGDEG